MDELKVLEVMSRRLITASPDTILREAARVMVREKIGCLPVVDRNLLVGIVTEADLLEMLVRETQRLPPWTFGGIDAGPSSCWLNGSGPMWLDDARAGDRGPMATVAGPCCSADRDCLRPHAHSTRGHNALHFAGLPGVVSERARASQGDCLV